MDSSALLIIASVCILSGLLLFVYSLVKREKEHLNHEEQTMHRYHRIINNANNEARGIIDSASVTSAGILGESKATSDHIEENLDKVLQTIAQQHIEHLKKTSDEFNKSYDERLVRLQEELKNHTEQAIHDSEQRLNESLEKYIPPLTQTALNSRALIDQRTKELMNQVEKELTNYKTARMAKIDAEIDQMVRKTYKEVLRKSIPDTLHEELIVESLEKAKAEGGITV